MPVEPRSAAPSPESRGRRVRIFPLSAEPPDDLAVQTTPEERVGMVASLTRRMWELSGRPWPVVRRQEMPIRILPLG